MSKLMEKRADFCLTNFNHLPPLNRANEGTCGPPLEKKAVQTKRTSSHYNRIEFKSYTLHLNKFQSDQQRRIRTRAREKKKRPFTVSTINFICETVAFSVEHHETEENQMR